MQGGGHSQGSWCTSIASPEGDFSWEATEKVHHVDHGGDGIFIFPTRRESVEGGGWVPAAVATPGRCRPGPPAVAEPGGPPGTLGPRLRKWKERGLSLECEPWVPLPAMSSLAPHRGQTLGFGQTLPFLPTRPCWAPMHKQGLGGLSPHQEGCLRAGSPLLEDSGVAEQGPPGPEQPEAPEPRPGSSAPC